MTLSECLLTLIKKLESECNGIAFAFRSTDNSKTDWNVIVTDFDYYTKNKQFTTTKEKYRILIKKLFGANVTYLYQNVDENVLSAYLEFDLIMNV
jgi:hypothetical protein